MSKIARIASTAALAAIALSGVASAAGTAGAVGSHTGTVRSVLADGGDSATPTAITSVSASVGIGWD